MNQEPINPIAPDPSVPPMPTGQDATTLNPAAAATPAINTEPVAPSVPEVPTIDPSLLQQAIADVPEEATATAPEVPPAVPLDNLGATAPEATTPVVENVEPSPFTNATPAADFNTPDTTTQTPTAPADPNAVLPENEATKTTPSVAFNDPAQQPDTTKPKNVNFSKIADGIKKRPVVAILVGGAIIIISLVLILAFAV